MASPRHRPLRDLVRLVAAAQAAFLLGCEAQPEAPLFRCDPTAGGIGFGIAAYVGADRLEPGSQVLADNGAWYLLVERSCRFWVTSREDSWQDLRDAFPLEGQRVRARLLPDDLQRASAAPV